jgi:hypothetical protein
MTSVSPRLPGPRPVPSRIDWVDGSSLDERDLDDAVAYEQRLLELHIRGVHDTWGVALGLTLALSADRRLVLVTPGLAYTCRGESIVLGVPVQVDAPALGGAGPGASGPSLFDLVIAFPAPPDGAPCEHTIGCDGDRLPVLRPVLRWERAGSAAAPAPVPVSPNVRLGDEVPIGRFVRLGDGTLTGPDYSQRRVARGLVRPHIAFGVTRPGELLWQAGASDSVATIDTTSAGFTTRPFYFAWMLDRPWSALDIGPFLSVGQATRSSFKAHLLVASRTRPPDLLIPDLMRDQRTKAASARVMWVGAEMTTGCPPSLLGASIYTVAGMLAANQSLWTSALAALGAKP